MKAHIAVDADSVLVHRVSGTSGNMSDVIEANSVSDRLNQLEAAG